MFHSKVRVKDEPCGGKPQGSGSKPYLVLAPTQLVMLTDWLCFQIGLFSKTVGLEYWGGGSGRGVSELGAISTFCFNEVP